MELHRWALAGLEAAIGKRLQLPSAPSNPAPGLPGEVFFSLFSDRSLAYHDWTAEFLKLRDRLRTANGSPLG